ncbi:MAG: GNAT family N-acetyltransferase [Chloroflexi bacterium]|nr:GNAT family N-acetyltransferase [Chloroflexota bacterium]
MITPAAFTAQIAHRFDEVDTHEWDTLSAGKPFQSARWYQFGERVLATCQPFYIIVSLSGKPVARGSFYLVRDEPLPIPPPAQTVLRQIMRRWPLLICRSPLSNSSGLLLPEGSLCQPARTRILAEAEKIALQQHCSFLLCDYIEAAETLQGWPAGYRSITVSGPGTWMPLEWPSFDAFLQARNKKGRQHYKRTVREGEKLGIRVQRRASVLDAESALALVRKVEQRHGAVSSPWSLELIKNLEDACGTFLEATINDRLVGCGLLFYDNDVQIATALGLKEDIPFVYFMLVYAGIQDAIEHHARILRWGSGAYAVKRRLGFRLETNNHSVYVAIQPFLRSLMALAG